MAVVTEIEELALALSDQDRARLADKLIASLPENFIDEDVIAEALRRDREMDEDPSKVITLEQLDELIANRPIKR